jgi:hypothetical protein
MMTSSQHVYEVRPRKDHRGVDLISDALPFGRLWYSEPNAIGNAIGYAMHHSRSHRTLSTTAKCVNFVIDLRLRSSPRFI